MSFGRVCPICLTRLKTGSGWYAHCRAHVRRGEAVELRGRHAAHFIDVKDEHMIALKRSQGWRG